MKRTLKLTVVSETYPPEINGVANTLRHLVGELRRRGHRVQLVRPRQATDAGDATRAGETLVPGLPLPGYAGLRCGLPVYWRLRRLWRQDSPELLYIATEGPLGHAALAAATALAIPALSGFHTRFDHYSRHYRLGWLQPAVANALRRFHNRSAATLVATADLRERLSEQGFANVRVFGRGVDAALFSPARRRADLRRQWGCGDEDPVLLYVGRVAAEKNVDLALRAFARAQAALPGARCVVVGDGPELARLRRAYPQFHFAGSRSGAELAEHYASADVFVFPSLSETFGNVVVEAMASGLAVVAFDEAAAHALIRSQGNGISVASGDERAFISAVVDAARTSEGLRAMRRAARASAEALAWARVIDAFETCMFEVLAQRPAPAGGVPRPASAARYARNPER